MSALFFLAALALLIAVLRRLWRRLPQAGPVRIPPPRPAGHPSSLPWPGEIWWAMVPFADVAAAKDRPCLVLSVYGDVATVVPITTKYHPVGAAVALPPGSVGDRQGRQSYLRTRERRRLPVSDFRRRAGTVDPHSWARVHRRF